MCRLTIFFQVFPIHAFYVLETYRSIPGVPTLAFSRVIDSDNSARSEPEGPEKMRGDRKKEISTL
jgi:hypothetical protein